MSICHLGPKKVLNFNHRVRGRHVGIHRDMNVFQTSRDTRKLSLRKFKQLAHNGLDIANAAHGIRFSFSPTAAATVVVRHD